LEYPLGALADPDILKSVEGRMQTIYIKFMTEEERTRGYYELARGARVSSLPGKVYQVPLDGLKILDDLHIGYRRASDAEVKDAHDQVRNPSAAVL
jgi:hypothetical protein